MMLASMTMTSAQIPNSGFEDWTSMGTYEVPNGWATVNGAIPNDLFFPCTKSTDHYPPNVGQYSMRLESNLLYQQGGWGISVTDTFAYPFEPAFAVVGHPNTLYGYYRYDSQAGDEAWIVLALFNEGALLHTSQFHGPASDVSEWTLFQLDIDSYSVADSATLMIFNFYPTTQDDGPNGNSVLYVDNLSFDTPITSVEELNGKSPAFSLCPNPATDRVQVVTAQNVGAGTTVSIYSIIGVLVCSETLNQDGQQVDVSALPSGTYMVELRTSETVSSRKLMIQR